MARGFGPNLRIESLVQRCRSETCDAVELRVLRLSGPSFPVVRRALAINRASSRIRSRATARCSPHREEARAVGQPLLGGGLEPVLQVEELAPLVGLQIHGSAFQVATVEYGS